MENGRLKTLVMKCLVSPIALAFVFAAVDAGDAQESFFKGKQVRIVVGLSAGGGYDRAARIVSRHIGKHIPGNPDVLVQNMPGASSAIAANYVWGVAKPDGLTILASHNNLYLSQIAGYKEVKLDLTRFNWIGSLENDDMMIFVRGDSPFKSMGDVVRASELPKCGSTGAGSADYVMSKILAETIGVKVEHVLGYPGSNEIGLALERGEINCMGLTIANYFASDRYVGWHKNKFVRMLAQGGHKRDPRIPDAPTIYELMDEFKTPPTKRRVAEAMNQGAEWARPFLVAPAVPTDRVATLRSAFEKATKDPDLLAEAKRLRVEVTPVRGEQLQKLAKEVLSQPPEVTEQIKKLFVQ
ncbi:MAG: tripartite tricarboxylate transporter substrate binding protein [Deltaproteobacteria bacterium]|nr:tripartite tricarboxylate transporter substrate binding protein [Deltaproteobacteria bacterium]